ncbi:transcriptional regulator ATRX-like protein [Perilla frutescens var. hirtella]|nr:transcriptional regulator ATRX-like protein [Perilla frutescens var. hirtella]
MGDSACLLHGFSYASAVPNESKQGNHMHALGESISFGRFTTETLSWERWSSFSHKKYVEEAERYARPGSVAQKKAFFEAHYKRIAAQRAAAALLEQENAADAKNEQVGDKIDDDREEGGLFLNPHSGLLDLGSGNVKIHDVKRDDSLGREKSSTEAGGERERENEVSKGIHVKSSSVKRLDDQVENRPAVSASESSETSQIEKPLLKHNSVDSEEVSSAMSKRRPGLSSLKTSVHHKTRRIPSTPAKTMTPQLKRENTVNRSSRKSNVDEKRSSPKSLRTLLSLGSFKESEKEAIFTNKRTESSGLVHSSSRAPKDCSTPFKTPAPASTKSVFTYPAATPQSENRRLKTPDPLASGRKTTGPKWHLLSAVCSKSLSAYRNKLQSPTVSTPFTLRTEERAAKRKQKLEEKFNATEVQKTQQKTLKEKAGKEFRKLSCSLCFKARPLPDFYKEREPPNYQTKKTPAPQPQTAVLGRSVSNKKHGTISMPPAPPPPMSLAKTRVSSISMPPPPPPPTSLANTRVSRNLSKKNDLNQSKFLNISLPERITHENASPNIQQ